MSGRWPFYRYYQLLILLPKYRPYRPNTRLNQIVDNDGGILTALQSLRLCSIMFFRVSDSGLKFQLLWHCPLLVLNWYKYLANGVKLSFY